MVKIKQELISTSVNNYDFIIILKFISYQQILST